VKFLPCDKVSVTRKRMCSSAAKSKGCLLTVCSFRCLVRVLPGIHHAKLLPVLAATGHFQVI